MAIRPSLGLELGLRYQVFGNGNLDDPRSGRKHWLLRIRCGHYCHINMAVQPTHLDWA